MDLSPRSIGALSPAALGQCFDRMKVNEHGRTLIHNARTNPPRWRETNSVGRMIGTFYSTKAGGPIQWTGWTTQRALLVLWEADRSVLEFWDRPCELTIRGQTRAGRSMGWQWFPHYLLIATDFCGLVDFQSSDELKRLTQEKPDQYVQCGAKQWECVPARRTAEEHGLGYRLHTELDIPYRLVRNLQFLHPKMGAHAPAAADGTGLRHVLQDATRLLFSSALQHASADLIFQGHFAGFWTLNLMDEVLSEPDGCYVYANPGVLAAHCALDRHHEPAVRPRLSFDAIHCGMTLRWGPGLFQVINKTRAMLFLQTPGAPLAQLRKAEAVPLLDSGELVSAHRNEIHSHAVLAAFHAASPAAMAKAVSKQELLERHWAGESVAGEVPERTLLAWQAAFRSKVREVGNGFVGLIDQDDRKGNRTPRKSKQERDVLDAAFQMLREPPRKTLATGYVLYQGLCEKEKVEPRSETSFRKHWRALSEYEIALDQEGSRAAYAVKPPRVSNAPSLALGPPEGDSPYQLAHLDHTQLDEFVRCRDGIQLLGKPWISLLVEAFTKLVLGIWISMLPPSTISVLMTLRDAVRRNGRLTHYVVTDGGSEFWSNAYQGFLRSHGVNWIKRPRQEPRYGNPVERLNLDISNEYARMSPGGNHLLHTPRMSSPSHDPRNLACRTLEQCAGRLEELLFDIYPNRPRAGRTARELQEQAMLLHGTQFGIELPYDDTIRFQTLVPAKKHGGLVRSRDGIRLNHLNYYSPLLQGHTADKLRDLPLFDAEDPNYIMARVAGGLHRIDLIDSQKKRLPSHGLPYYLSEHVFLSRASTSTGKTHAFRQQLAEYYQRAALEDQKALPSPAPVAPPAATDPPAAAPESRPASPKQYAPAPVSTRPRT